MPRPIILLILLLASVGTKADVKWVDVTANFLSNPSFDHHSTADWTISGEASALGAMSFSCMEMWNGYIRLEHQQADVPNGHYRIRVQALYRTRGHERAYQEHVDGTEFISGYLFANTEQVAVQSEYNFWFDQSPGRSYTPDDEHYYANSMETAQKAFSQGAYENELEFDVTDGTVSFGLYNDPAYKHGDNWLIFDNFRLEQQVTTVDPTAGSLCFNELVAANVDMLMSPACNFDSWVELYNTTDEALTLGGCYLSDDAANLRKWQLPDAMGNIAPHGYQVVWMGSNDIRRQQAPFKLDCEGGALYLTNAQGTVVCSIAYPEAISRTAYARMTDGGAAWSWTAEPTPGADNSTTAYATERLEAPEVRPDGQLFDGTLRVQARRVAGTTLRYTTDGTTPTLEHGETSENGVLTVAATTTVRFRLFKDGQLPSPVVSRTYIKRDHPHTLPVIAVSTKDAFLYNDEIGVYVKGTNGRTGNGQSTPANWNMDWDRPVNFQYLLPESNTMVVNQDVDFAISGGWTRSSFPKSFKLKADRVYEGQNAIGYPFFQAKPYIKNKTLQVRYGGNDTWCRIKDAAIHEVLQRSGLDLDVMSYQPAVHYVNGEYRGLINIREPNNKDFAYANWGLGKDELEVYEQSPDSGAYMMLGTQDVLDRLYELSQTAAQDDSYEEIMQLLDIDEYINYMAAELYLSSWDWPDNNVKAYRPVNGGRYRFTFFDLDAAFGTEGREWDEEGEVRMDGNPLRWIEGMQWHRYDYIYDTAERRYGEMRFCTFFLNMLDNSTFRRRFIDALGIMGGSVFEQSRVSEILDELGDRVRTTMSWEGASPDGSLNEIRNALNGRPERWADYMRDYAPLRLGSVSPVSLQLMSNVPSATIYMNDQPIPYADYTGPVFPPVTLSVEAPPGYRFVGWGPSKNPGWYYSHNAIYKLTEQQTQYTLVACFEPLAESVTPPVVVNEVSGDNSIFVNDHFKRNDWVELYNTTGDTIDVAGMFLSDDAANAQKYTIAAAGSRASTLVPPYGHLVVWCDHLEPLTQLHAPFKIDKDGGVITLQAADGAWTDALAYSAHGGQETVGRYPDGNAAVYVMNVPTIARANLHTSYLTEVDQTGVQGVNELVAGGDLSLRYAAGHLVVRGAANEVSVEVWQLDGKQVMALRVPLYNNKVEIDCSHLKPGYYIARVTDGQGTVRVRKVRRS